MLRKKDYESPKIEVTELALEARIAASGDVEDMEWMAPMDPSLLFESGEMEWI